MFKPFGKYTILKKIASGGMAEIFLASDLSPTGIARFVVIKRALAQYSDNKEFRDMFKNEGKVACNLKHRNIAPIYEFGIDSNQFYLAMEYISGRNLRELVKKLRNLKKFVDIRYAVYIIKEVASGLNYAHNAIESSTGQPLNLIHRDISPQNIMLSFDGEIRIIDFGISKISDTDLTHAGHLKGKFSYMSPEQARGEVIDGRTDIFCLGIMLWELLSGQRLFSAKDEINALKKIRSCHVPDIRKINPKIPKQLADIVNQALHKNKNLRTKTAATLEKELNIFLNKQYPEFSQYDFMHFVKEIYSKEIIGEREQLKKYSKEYKNYINKLNTENDFQVKLGPNSLNDQLDIPNIDSLQANIFSDKQESLTKTQKVTGDLSDYVTFTQSKANEPDSTETPEQENTVLLKGKNYDTTKINENHLNEETSKNDQTKTETPSHSKNNINFDIIKDDKVGLSAYSNAMTTKNSKLKNYTSSYKSQKSLSQIHTIEKATKTIKNTVAFILIFSIGFSVFYAFKNKEKIIYSKKLDKFFIKEPKPQPQHTTQKDSPKTQRDIGNISIKSIWVQTKPSGATIYINKTPIANTPTKININLKEINKLTIYKAGYHSKSILKNQIYKLKNSLYITLQKKQKKRKPSNVTIIR